MGIHVWCCQHTGSDSKTMIEQPWNAQWISVDPLELKGFNQWICFRRAVTLDEKPASARARIAADSKYWLWINGTLVVHEGQLKRGPTPNDTYFDEIDLVPYLRTGENTLALLLWYFGKEGFCHKSSGVAAMVFEGDIDGSLLPSDHTWKVRCHPSFGESAPPHPNVRLPESNIHFDARLDIPGWNVCGFDDSSWRNATELGRPPTHPWNRLFRRPVPLWRFGDLLPYSNEADFPNLNERLENIVLRVRLPGNLPVCPALKIDARPGLKLSIYTDNYRGGSEYNVRVDYITREGIQEFESPAYLTGHEVVYDFPAGVRVLELKYRHSHFDTAVVGRFESSDPLLNSLWHKAANTMLLNMRDGIQDPDRERAQWWGDVVILIGMIAHSCDQAGLSAVRKAIHNLVDWQKPDGVLYSPVPAGNWFLELPDQMLAAVGKYGFWYYFLHTGDRETIAHAYPAVKRYLDLWQTGPDGLVIRRTGGWDWGDWGENKDMPVLINAWFYMALESAKNMALLLGDEPAAAACQSKMDRLRKSFNRTFWTGAEYRSPDHVGEPDDRVAGLAVVAGLAEKEFFKPIGKVLERRFEASPYMEKYVLEALFTMDLPDQALERMRNRYRQMVESKFCTLWETWSLGDAEAAKSGGGGYNHGWGGGPLTLMAEQIAGIRPLAPGFTRFRIAPRIGLLERFDCAVPARGGLLEICQEKSAEGYQLTISVPEGCFGDLHLPSRSPIELAPGKFQLRIAGAVKPQPAELVEPSVRGSSFSAKNHH